jgi:hypothetical protein
MLAAAVAVLLETLLVLVVLEELVAVALGVLQQQVRLVLLIPVAAVVVAHITLQGVAFSMVVLVDPEL